MGEIISRLSHKNVLIQDLSCIMIMRKEPKNQFHDIISGGAMDTRVSTKFYFLKI